MFIVLIFAIQAVTTRRLSGLHFSVMQFYLGLTGFLIAGIWLLIYSQSNDVFKLSGGSATLIKLGASCLVYFSAQICSTCLF